MYTNKCCDKRKCFGQYSNGKETICLILSSKKNPLYLDGMCPFCKPVKSVTNGVTYEYSDGYRYMG